MKRRKLQKNDYRSSTFIGILLFFVGIGSWFNGKNSIIDMITIIGSIGLIGQSVYQYKKQKQL